MKVMNCKCGGQVYVNFRDKGSAPTFEVYDTIIIKCSRCGEEGRSVTVKSEEEIGPTTLDRIEQWNKSVEGAT